MGVIYEIDLEGSTRISCNGGSFIYKGIKIDGYQCTVSKINGNIDVTAFSTNNKILLGRYYNYIDYEYYTHISEDGLKYKNADNYYYECTGFVRKSLNFNILSEIAQGIITVENIKITEYSKYFILTIDNYLTERNDVSKVYLNKETKLIDFVEVSKNKSNLQDNSLTYKIKISYDFDKKYEEALKIFEKYEQLFKI